MISHEALISTANQLPPLPQTVSRLVSLIADPYVRFDAFVEVIELDPNLTAKLLRVANSVAYRGVEAIHSVRDAALRMGTGSVLSMAFAANVKPGDDYDLSAYGMTVDEYWNHSVSAMIVAEEFSRSARQTLPIELPSTALLHDFGKLILSKHLTPQMAQLLKEAQSSSERLSLVEAEMGVLEITHPEVGAVVAEHWNLPAEMIAGIQFHHSPEQSRLPIAAATHVVNHLVRQIEGRDDDVARDADVVDGSLAALGVAREELERVRENAAERLESTLDSLS